MNKKNFSFEPADYFALWIGIALIAVGVIFLLAANGHGKLLNYILIAIGIVVIIISVLVTGLLGTVGVLFVIWIILQLLEAFMKPIAYLFFVAGIIVIVWWIKDSIVRDPV